MLDSFSLHDARGLEDQKIVVGHADLPAELPRVVVRRRRGIGEIHHVRNDPARKPGPPAELLPGQAVDHHVLDLRQRRGKSVTQDIVHRTDQKPLAFPEEIVVMGHAREPLLLNLGDQGHPER